MFKQEKGVTLVALVITIIVLLILAGVSISMVAGDNGVLTKASKSSNKTKYGATVEAVNLACADLQSDYVDAMSSGTAEGMEHYYTKYAMVRALANQGYTISEKASDAESYTVLTETNTVTGTGETTTKLALDSYDKDATNEEKAAAATYRVYANGASNDYVELQFMKQSMGYTPKYVENKLGTKNINE